MADTIRQQVITAAVAELQRIPDLRGARHDYPWDIFEQRWPYAWVYDLDERPDYGGTEESEHYNVVCKLSLGIEIYFEAPKRGDLLPEFNRLLGLVQAQFGAAMTEEVQSNWRDLRRLAEYFDETENSAQEVPNERDAFLGVVVTNWTASYTRTVESPYAQ